MDSFTIAAFAVLTAAFAGVIRRERHRRHLLEQAAWWRAALANRDERSL